MNQCSRSFAKNAPAPGIPTSSSGSYRDAHRWVYRKPHGFTPTLYRPNAIQRAAKTGAWVWVTEGEKDADTLTALGCIATTNAQGAANFPAELADAFTGLNVAIVADRDLAGYQRAINLYDRLHGSTAQIVLLIPAIETDKADVTDHVNAGLWERNDPFGGFTLITPPNYTAWPQPPRPAGPPSASTPLYRKPAPTTTAAAGSPAAPATRHAGSPKPLTSFAPCNTPVTSSSGTAASTAHPWRTAPLKPSTAFSSASPPTTGATIVAPQFAPPIV